MIIKVLLTIIFLVVMIGVGVYTRKQASSVEGFVLGGRAVVLGSPRSPLERVISLPWSLWATQDSSDGNMVCHLRGLVSAMPSSVRCWPGFF